MCLWDTLWICACVHTSMPVCVCAHACVFALQGAHKRINCLKDPERDSLTHCTKYPAGWLRACPEFSTTTFYTHTKLLHLYCTVAYIAGQSWWPKIITDKSNNITQTLGHDPYIYRLNMNPWTGPVAHHPPQRKHNGKYRCDNVRWVIANGLWWRPEWDKMLMLTTGMATEKSGYWIWYWWTTRQTSYLFIWNGQAFFFSTQHRVS